MADSEDPFIICHIRLEGNKYDYSREDGWCILGLILILSHVAGANVGVHFTAEWEAVIQKRGGIVGALSSLLQ